MPGADRDVTLRLQTRPAPNIDEPLKRVGRAAREAGRESAGLDDALKKARHTVESTTKALIESANACRAFARDERALAAAVDARRAAQEKANAISKAERAAGLGGKGGGAGGALASGFGKATAVLGILSVAAAGVGALNLESRRGGPFGFGSHDPMSQGGVGSFGIGGFNPTMDKERLNWWLGEKGFGNVGNLLPMRNPLGQALEAVGIAKKLPNARSYEQLQLAKYRGELAQTGIGYAGERLGVEQRGITRQDQLRAEMARSQALLQFGSSSLGAQFALGTAGQRAAEAAQLRTGGTAGYGRAERQADVLAKMQSETALRQQQVEQDRQLKVLDAERANAADTQLEKQRRLAQSEQQLKQARASVAAAERQGAPHDEVDRRKLAVQQALQEVMVRQNDLMQGADQLRRMDEQRGQTLLQQQQQRVALMEQERDRLTSIVQQERQRLQGGRESFGLQSPLSRMALVGISRKIKGGGQLTQRELEFAQSHGGDLFRPAVQQIGAERAGPAYDEIVKNLGAGQRLQQAEQARVALENKISVEIKINEEALAKQLQQQLIPQVLKAAEQARMATQTAAEKLEQQRAAQARALAPR